MTSHISGLTSSVNTASLCFQNKDSLLFLSDVAHNTCWRTPLHLDVLDPGFILQRSCSNDFLLVVVECE